MHRQQVLCEIYTYDGHSRWLHDSLQSVILEAETIEPSPMYRKSFTPEDPALPMNYPGFVFRTLCQDGYPADALLAETGLDEPRLSDPHFRCGFQPLRRLFLNAIEQTGDPNLGIGMALQFQPTYIGLPAYTAMNAGRFEEGLDVLTRFFFLNFPAFEVRLVDHHSGLQAGEAAIRLRSKFPFEDIEYFGFSSALIAINGLLNTMLRTDQVATRAEMSVKTPDGWRAQDARISFPIRFGAVENQIIFPAALLDQPLPGADTINHARFLKLCEQFAEEMAFETTPVSRLIAVLEGATSLTVSLADIAAELGYSERGLRRQLDRSGTSYRLLLDQVRERRARSLLSSTTQPIKAIAGTLGFESSSNFARSFKRWTGLTPVDFRDQARAQADAGQK
ncbi:AraC family transcriptional regulator [Gemmobacter denitrificans]|uniref:AraC family transcriptional regulator ligand-binding domain-containing protein n=1 Tax=Gemmobacter denitrificans TaxID=3123040 RepID=A0ABU8BWU3_9RHOB